MSTVALACCSMWPEGHEDDAGLVEALGELGIDASWVVWDDAAVDWSSFDRVVIRQTWDYPIKLTAFLAWVDRVAASSRLVNPAPVVRWNHHKGYLLELERLGVPVVPTELVRAGTPVEPRSHDAVLKPAVGVGGDGAVLLRGGGSPGSPVDVDLLVQPYVPSIETEGETSIIVLGGELSHAIRKLPAVGEFRVHEHRGGTYAVVEPSQPQAAVAGAALAAAQELTGHGITYARVDLVAGADQPRVLELELIEPSLYLHHVPGATATLAELVAG